MSNIATVEGFRLSPQQKHLWALHQNDPSLPYGVQCAILLEGKLNAEILNEAIQEVVKRHEILRTTFHRQPGMKTPFQIVSDNSMLLWDNLDLSGLSSQEQKAATEQLFQQKIEHPYNFEHSPLLRTSLITQLPNRHLLIVGLPALCADTWTLKNFMGEVSDAYAACLNDEELSEDPLQYVDFSEWHNELLDTEDQFAEQGKSFWLKKDISSLPPMRLPLRSETRRQYSSHSFSR